MLFDITVAVTVNSALVGLTNGLGEALAVAPTVLVAVDVGRTIDVSVAVAVESTSGVGVGVASSVVDVAEGITVSGGTVDGIAVAVRPSVNGSQSWGRSGGYTHTDNLGTDQVSALPARSTSATKAPSSDVRYSCTATLTASALACQDKV